METKDNTTTPVEETRKCRVCGNVLPLSKFEKYGRHGYHTACKACEGKDVGVNDELNNFTSRELILELRARGYKGKLTKITTEEVVI